jgi:hypothetical protein
MEAAAGLVRLSRPVWRICRGLDSILG